MSYEFTCFTSEISERFAEDKAIMHANNHVKINKQYLKWSFL